MLLEIIDHPHLLWTDINYTCQLCIALSTLSYICTGRAGCVHFVTALSELRLPYSCLALICVALDEIANALSVLGHEQELAPGYLRYPRPPFPLSATEKRSNGMILQQFDAKTFIFRSAIHLYNLLLHVLQHYETSHEDGRIIPGPTLDKTSTHYVVQTCVRSIHIVRTFRGTPLSLAFKLERECLRVLAKLASIRSLPDLDTTTSGDKDIVELVLHEILSEGQCSPRSCDTAGSILSFLTTEWKPRNILMSNRLLGFFQEMFHKHGPEFSELLQMWDGNREHSHWLLRGGNDTMMSMWEEILSRIEFWILKGHSRYTLKWVSVLRSLLVRSMENSAALVALDDALLQRDAGLSFEKWVDKISELLPETEMETFNEITALRPLRREATPKKATDAVMGKAPCKLA